MKSMTAFAGSEIKIGHVTIGCELRSVNHRFLDLSLRLPERLRFIEADLRTILSSQISRGKVDCTLIYSKQSDDKLGLIIDPDAVTSLLALTSQIEQQMQSPAPFSALEVLAFPGVQHEPSVDKEELEKGIKKLVKDTLVIFLGVRQREGEQLKQLIDERCLQMQELVRSGTKRMPIVKQLVRQKLTDKIAELNIQPNSDRFEQEIIFWMQKIDISEELDRLEIFIAEVRRVLTLDEPVGRRLDFLMQELNRETNTLGAKSVDKDMPQISVDLKVLIEQMREQIQNIE